MKKTAFVVAGLVLAGISGFTIARRLEPPPPPPDSSSPPAQEQSVQSSSPAPAETVVPTVPVRRAAEPANLTTSGPAPESAPPTVAGSKPAKSAVSPIFNQAVETLASPQAGFAQRMAAWQQLKAAGQLDQTITEFEQRAAANPRAPEYPAALGQAYLQKAGSIQDVREQGILGMKADQTFEAALQLDPNNWDARFWKATAMTYWPVMLGKSNEVIENFATLITQQEAQAPQPHFAQTYTQLGDYYQKLGHADYAQQIWQRGAALFPENQALRSKLATR